MTMQELSPQYARQAEAVSRRLRELRHQALTEGDPERVQALRRRQQELRPLLQEAREKQEDPEEPAMCLLPPALLRMQKEQTRPIQMHGKR